MANPRGFCVRGGSAVGAVLCFVLLLAGCASPTGPATGPVRSGSGTVVESVVNPFLGPPRLELQSLFASNRFPTVTVAMDGSILAFWNGVVVRRSEDGGGTWSDEISVGPGFMGGGVTVDESSGDILAFVETAHPPAEIMMYRSRDHGRTWRREELRVESDVLGNRHSMHMNEHGITLRRGRHAGRIIRPSRSYGMGNQREFWPEHYTGAIHSDDGGRSWKTSDPFPAKGTGEAALAELASGRIYYNSRRHWAPQGEDPRHRWEAWSDDGGQTWRGLRVNRFLPDGDQDRDYGLMGGLVRLPVAGRDILLFSNIVSPGGRHHGQVWASFDGGRSWPIRRLVYEGAFAYSSMDAGRPGTPGEGWIYLLFEGGPEGTGTMARFNLSWVLGGEMTGDGKVPRWVVPHRVNVR